MDRSEAVLFTCFTSRNCNSICFPFKLVTGAESPTVPAVDVAIIVAAEADESTVAPALPEQ